MFKKDINPGTKQKLKSSVQRSLRQSLLTAYPLLAPHIDEAMPKKASLEQMKLPAERASLFILDGQPLFYQQDFAGSPLVPHLRLVHRFPHAFPSIRIDRGAIRFVLSGATLMAPGLTSKGGRLPEPRQMPPRQPPVAPAAGDADKGAEDVASPVEGPDEDGHWSRELEKGEAVVVLAEGKDEACAVGVLVMGTKEVKEKGKGPVIEEGHYLGDGLWRLTLA